jgi:predicted dehydrogenase
MSAVSFLSHDAPDLQILKPTISPPMDHTTMSPPATPEDETLFTQPPTKQSFTTPPHILIIGAGSRGTAYAEAALECSNSVVAAICEPIAYKRKEFGRKFVWQQQEAQAHQEFEDWKSWVAYEKERRKREGERKEVEKGVDAVFVCVLDEMHEEVICGIAGLGVHICCEKPLSTSLESCVNIWRALKGVGGTSSESERMAQRKESIFGICHVLRYSPHNMLLRQLLLEREVVGEVLSLEHVEPVGWWHFSVSRLLLPLLNAD